MSEERMEDKVKMVEARIASLEKKIDMLLNMLMQEVSANLDCTEDCDVLEIPEGLQHSVAFELKQDSEFN